MSKQLVLEPIGLGDALIISRDKNQPISIVDFPWISATFQEIKKEFGQKEDTNISQINSQIIPFFFAHITDTNPKIEKVFDEDAKLSKFKDNYTTWLNNRHNNDGTKEYFTDIDQYISFVTDLFEGRSKNDSRETKILKNAKREMFNVLFAQKELTRVFPNIQEVYHQAEETFMKEMYNDEIPDKRKGKVLMEHRPKGNNATIEKALTKKNITLKQALTDNIGVRFVVLSEDTEEMEKIKEYLVEHITSKINDHPQMNNQDVILENRGEFVKDDFANNRAGTLHKNNTQKKDHLISKPHLKRFPTFKFVGKWTDESDSKKRRYPIEIQVLDIDGAKEEGRSARAFYHAKKRLHYTPRGGNYTTIPRHKIQEILYNGLLYQLKSLQNDMKTIESLKESKELSSEKNKFLTERFKKINLPDGTEILFHEEDNSIKINNEVINGPQDHKLETLCNTYINYLTKEDEITRLFHPGSKNGIDPKGEYYVPLELVFNYHLSGVNPLKIHNAKIGLAGLGFPKELKEKLLEKIKNTTDENDKRLYQQAQKIITRLNIGQSDEKNSISVQNFAYLYFAYLASKDKLNSEEHRDFKKYYINQLKSKFPNLKKPPSQ